MRRDLWTKHFDGTHPAPGAPKARQRRKAEPLRKGAVRPSHHQRYSGSDEEIPEFQFVPVTPTPKPRMSRSDAWKLRPTVARYRAFCDEVRFRGARLPQAYKLTFLIPMPASWTSREKAERAGTPHLTRPDASNLAKATEDALVAEDSVLWRIAADKLWSYNPGIIIEKAEPTISERILTLTGKKEP